MSHPPSSRRPQQSRLACKLQDFFGHPVSDLEIAVRSAVPPVTRSVIITLANGSANFNGLSPGPYDVTVAGGILLPPRRVQLNSPASTLVLRLPLSLPQAGRAYDTVSVEQLTVSERAQTALRKAYEAWERMDIQQSRAQAMRALQLHPNYGPALSLLGVLQLRDGHPEDALISLLQAVQTNASSPRTYLALSSAYNELHQPSQALYALSIMAKLSPESWQRHYEAGRAYLGQSHFQEAIDEFNRAQQVAPHEIAVLRVGKAHALLGLHDYTSARNELETVVRESPADPYAVEARQLALVLDSQLKKSAPPDATALGAMPEKLGH